MAYHVVLIWFLCFCLKSPSQALSIGLLKSELSALLTFKSSLEDPLGHLKGWSFGANASACNWKGITCFVSNNAFWVIAIELPSCNLSGTIAKEILLLKSLKTLNLANNNISGEIPAGIFNLTQLASLELSHNNLGGAIPSGFQNARALEVLNLEDNNFTGGIPTDIGNQSSLKQLRLRGNNELGGVIPDNICSLSSLNNLSLSSSALIGTIPDCLGNLTNLTWLFLGYNNLNGTIPASLSNLEKINRLDLVYNSLTGLIPPELGRLSNLTHLYLYNNGLTGEIPAEFGNLSSLTDLDISVNRLTGRIPDVFNGLLNLQLFHAYNNSLQGPFPQSLADIPSLNVIHLFNNQLEGPLPLNLGKNSSLVDLDLCNNNFWGPIPIDICAGNVLQRLILFNNSFSGSLPPSLANCRSLSRLRLENNQLSGAIPESLFALPALNFCSLGNNRFNGSLKLQDSTVQELHISYNQLSGTLPDVSKLQSVIRFTASGNCFSGIIPEGLGSLTKAITIDLSHNMLAGSIPSLDECESLVTLDLSYNSLQGKIPAQLGNLPALGMLYLSHNKLSGPIPSALEYSITLEHADLSYNNLSGICALNEGVFVITENPYLCNSDHDKCGEENKRRASTLSRKTIRILATVCFGAALLICCISIWYYRKCMAIAKKMQPAEEKPWKLKIFQEKHKITVLDILCCMQEDNKIGAGGGGTVYQGNLKDGTAIAVKRLHIKEKFENKRNDFIAEIEILGMLKHRNILKLLASCSSEDTQILVYEYMCNGSLGSLLHSPRKADLNWDSRMKIIQGIAEGLLYLHEDCGYQILHRDINCNNVLLDADLLPRIGDFGLAKLRDRDAKPEFASKLAGTCGYIAPEYACLLKISEKADVYSFGVIVLEILTGHHAILDNGIGIIEWLGEKITYIEAVSLAFDPTLNIGGSNHKLESQEMLRLAFLCTNLLPHKRPSMKEIVCTLKVLRQQRVSGIKTSMLSIDFIGY